MPKVVTKQGFIQQTISRNKQMDNGQKDAARAKPYYEYLILTISMYFKVYTTQQNK